MKQFARRRVEFDDANGVSFHGLWCANLTVEKDVFKTTDRFSEVQTAAKLAAVAIPLWYVIGKDHPNSNKYCVITNWWKYRMQDGWYRLPTLDPTLYGGEFKPMEEEDEEIVATVRIVGGMQTGEL